MALFSLTDEWTIELGEDFERRVEDGSMVFVLDDRAIWIDLFEDSRTPQEKMRPLQEGSPKAAQKWEFWQDNLLKFGYLEHDEDNENFELTTFSAEKAGYALITIYFDDEKSLDWAIGCWKSLQFEANA